MEEIVLVINGVDFTPFLTEKGLKYKRNDLEADGAGRTTMDGRIHRARIAVKITWDVSCRPIADEDIQRVLNAIYPEFVEVQLHDPMRGPISGVFYSNNVSVTLDRVLRNGKYMWEGLKFPLIEE